MADTKISAMVPGTVLPLTGAEIVPLIQNGLNVAASVAAILLAGGLYIPAAPATVATIQAAITTAKLNTNGGVIQLPPGQTNLTASIVPQSGIYFVGQMPMLNCTTGIPDATSVTAAGGTMLAPTGAFPAFSWNTTPLAAPASQAAFSATGLTNIGFKSMAFVGGSHGILAGAANNASCWWSEFDNLYFFGQSSVGIQLTNYQHCRFDRQFSFNCQWGQLHIIDVAASFLAPGNSTYGDMYNIIPQSSATNMTARGITFITQATSGGPANNNEFYFRRIQSNNFNRATTTQAATMANTQANITITDGTKWAVGMPATASATVNGFTINKIYFVASVVGNVIQLALTYGGAAIAATGNTAVNLVNTGFPAFEMISLAGNTNTNAVIENLDVEGGGTCAVFFQNCNGIKIGMSQVPLVGQSPISICFRGCVNKQTFAPQSVSTDDDQSAVGAATQFFGAKFGTSVGYQGQGIWYDATSGNGVLSLGSQFATQALGELTFIPGTAGGILMPKVMGLGQLPKVVSGNPIAITNLNLCYVNVSNPGAYTLPTANAANAGCWVEMFNNSGANQTVNTDGTQLINNIAARTSFTLADKASCRLQIDQITGGAVYTWTLKGSSTPMTAGVIAAPT